MSVSGGTSTVSPKRPKFRALSGVMVRTDGTGIRVLLPRGKTTREHAATPGRSRERRRRAGFDDGPKRRLAAGDSDTESSRDQGTYTVGRPIRGPALRGGGRGRRGPARRRGAQRKP